MSQLAEEYIPAFACPVGASQQATGCLHTQTRKPMDNNVLTRFEAQEFYQLYARDSVIQALEESRDYLLSSQASDKLKESVLREELEYARGLLAEHDFILRRLFGAWFD